MKHKMVVMMGGQGAGKGTFSKMLMARGDYTYIETGAILRTAPADSDIGRMVARGELVPDNMLIKLMAEKINYCTGDIILDGFPRTQSQAQWLVEHYAGKWDIHIIYLDVPNEVLLHRINKRFHEGSCHRTDDSDTAIIQRRLNAFYTQTKPAIEWLHTAPGIKFATIDATGEPDTTLPHILDALN